MNRSLIDRRRAKELLARLHEAFIDELTEHLLEQRSVLLQASAIGVGNALGSYAEVSSVLCRLASEYCEDERKSVDAAADEGQDRPCQVKILQCAKVDIETTIAGWLEAHAGVYPISVSLADRGLECTVIVIYYPPA